MYLPGSTLGVMGGGQLGRMFTADALRMGYRVVVYDPDARAPAALIASQHICSAYDDKTALDEMIDLCDAITIEFENIPIESLEYIEKRVTLSPAADSVRIAQDRLLEKNFFKDHGLATPAFAEIHKLDDVASAVATTALPCIIKTARFGYDGKGQAVCHTEQEVSDAFIAMEQVPCILEEMIALDTEVSVILARGRDGEISTYPLAENQHTRGILDITHVPSNVSASHREQALQLAHRLAEELDYVGVLAVELFISQTGDVLINEIAPRPHNSGHFTQDATRTSQFEQQVRTMSGLKPGCTELTSSVAMLNLLGDLWGDSQPNWSYVFESDACYLHLYAKHEARLGRKMGHINILGDDANTLKEHAIALKQRIAR